MISRTATGSALRTLTRATTQNTKPSPRTYRHVQSQLRLYSSSSQQQPPSATGVFYKTFTRPVAKCLLTALFVYQVIYWGWSKLEVDEIKEERQAEITKLEAQVRALQLQREKQKEADEAAAAAFASKTEATTDSKEKKKGWGWW
ncbi:hypothetical protein B0T20DRAFT_11875 [Sordaria brevicollis]|uniref:Uncharacterized protein n=1 Tax=Sordaria brevicollis TaxID=83679 RepID=A0AAE0UGY1_SORBR|nr:hypothetical protein B0T20DRAFT_11875 [Sordaria brevicollis]